MAGKAGGIIIAGAGPAGLVTALELARRGIASTVLEVAPSLPQDLRATTFHPPTLDMLDRLGVARILALGNRSPLWQFRDRTLGRIAEFDLGLIADRTTHPYRLQCEQFHLTEVLLAALEESGVSQVLFGTAIESFDQDSDGVTVRCRTGTEETVLHGRFLIGADGGRSTVRKQLPVSFDGFTYTDRLIQVGTPFPFRDHLSDIADVNYIADATEWCVLLQIAGYWRVSFPLKPEEDEASSLQDDALEERLQCFLPQPARYEITHRKCWRIHQRVASDFRHGRVVLMGDAAHVNSPHGGMGMNSAIHDAVNLAEKLAGIGSGDAGAVLDRYTRQRRFVAQEDVRVQSMRNSQLMSEQDPAIRRERLDAMRRMADDSAAARRFLLESSMITGLEKSLEIA